MKPLLLLCLLTGLQLAAQNPLVIKTVGNTNLEPTSDAQLIRHVKPWNGKLFYQGKGTNQCNLVTTDGTTAGTVLVKDLGNIGDINGVYPAQDFVYIATLKVDLVSTSPLVFNWARQLWRSDGTAAGTYLLKAFDITNNTNNSGIFSSDASSSVNYSIDGNTIYFNGYDAVNGPELWKSDGTPAGTAMVKDILSGSGGGHPFGFCRVGSTTLFFARDSPSNYQLWQTDGTAGGTQQLVAINSSAQSIAEFYCGLYKGKMYFWANDGSNGAEVWYSDGTASGTQMLKDITSGNNATTGTGGMRTDLMFIQDDQYLYFPVERSKYVWRTDGTEEGTIQLNSTAMTSAVIAGAIAKGKGIYWQDNVTTLYKSDGTVNGTSVVTNSLVQAIQLYSYRNAAWFAARLPNNSDLEPWRSDGTAANTARALDIYPGGFSTFFNSSDPLAYFELNGFLYFFATSASGKQLFRYNGDMTFNGSVAGGRWRDSTNWNSMMPPGITDTAYINSGLTANIDGAKAYAGTIIQQPGSSLNLLATTDSVFIHKEIKGLASTGAGAVVLKSFTNDTVRVNDPASAGVLNAQSPVYVNGSLSIATQLRLNNNGKLILNNNDARLTGTSSSIIAGASNYIITNGTGRLIIENIGTAGRTGTVVFPVGTATYYNPVSITNTGTPDAFGTRVQSGIYSSYAGETPAGGAYTSKAVDATWFIDEAIAGGSNAAITLQWNAGQELALFDRPQARTGHYTAGNWQLEAAGTLSGTDPYTVTGNYTSFSPFGVLSGPGATLPVQLLSFTASLQQQKVRLDWSTSSESNSRHFIVERSATGRSFEAIGTVNAAGNSNSLNNYQYSDMNPLSGTSWYRLRQVDMDGRSTLSPIVQVSNPSLSKIKMVQRGDQLFVDLDDTYPKLVVQVADMSGRIVLQQQFNNQRQLTMNAPAVRGNYVMVIRSKEAILYSGGFIRN
jgi:ELWxxDGT repeat protein